MKIQDIMSLSEDEKKDYEEFFEYEKLLMDTEDDLIRDLEYYSKRLKSLGDAKSAFAVGIFTVYKAHLNSIQRLIDIIENLRNYEIDSKKPH